MVCTYEIMAKGKNRKISMHTYICIYIYIVSFFNENSSTVLHCKNKEVNSAKLLVN